MNADILEIERCVFDADDIDRIIRTKPLASIDREVKKAQVMLKGDLPIALRTYWTDYLKAHEQARDIAWWCVENNIGTVEVTPNWSRDKEPKVIHRFMEVLETVKEIDNKGEYTLKLLYTHIEMHKVKKKENKYASYTNE